MPTVTIMDPVTRIEGHLKVEVTIDEVNGKNQVVEALCTGTLFRDFEKLLEGREPTDAPLLTERICGVCPVSHGQASVAALEKAAGLQAPTNARIVRNLILGANYVQSHILHFYLLAALDYVNGPQVAPWAPAWDVDLRSDPALTEVGGHLPQAIEARRRAHEMAAIFGGKMPHPQTHLPGGVTAVPTAERISEFRGHLTWLLDFIKGIYLPDVQAVGQVYSDHFSVGTGVKNLLAYGVFDLDDSGGSKLLRRGQILNGAKTASAVDQRTIAEQVGYSWYDGAYDNLNPSSGRTEPLYPKGAAYSWLKAPRLGGKPYEVGPLARMWVNGDYQQGISVMDRHLARVLECLKVAEALDGWLGELTVGAPVYSRYQAPESGAGIGLNEAPRGALGHWVRIAGGKISRYQIITPTCWNASPRDTKGVRGPMERALVGTVIQDPARPIEALRVIHSFDPCLSCAVHVMRPDGEAVVVRARRA